MLYVRLQETLWPGFCYCLVVREQRPPLTVCLQSADNVHSLIKRCSQRGIYAVNNSQKPPLSIRRPTARRVVTLDEKIRKAETAVASAKAKYDTALDELEKLVAKRKQLDDKKVLEAYHAGDKTADEIVAFIQEKTIEEE